MDVMAFLRNGVSGGVGLSPDWPLVIDSNNFKLFIEVTSPPVAGNEVSNDDDDVCAIVPSPGRDSIILNQRFSICQKIIISHIN